MHGREDNRLGELEVLMDESASTEDVLAVEEAFRDAGLAVVVRPAIGRKGVGDFPWIVMFTVPLTAFLTAFAAEAGKEAYAGLKNLVRSIWSARTRRTGPPGSCIIVDERTGVWIHLKPDIPNEAYQALAEIDLESMEPPAVLVYDDNTRRWIASL